MRKPSRNFIKAVSQTLSGKILYLLNLVEPFSKLVVHLLQLRDFFNPYDFISGISLTISRARTWRQETSKRQCNFLSKQRSW